MFFARKLQCFPCSADEVSKARYVLISLRKQIDESELFALRFRALLKALLGLTTVLPSAALPANDELFFRCKKELERVTAPLTGEPAVTVIEEAGRVAVREMEAICRSNKAALAERDTALKDVVATVAEAVSHFKGHGERHQARFSKLAGSFEVLSHVEDAGELRRRLRDAVSNLRESVEVMHRENEESVVRFQSQVSTFQRRLETARKESAIDRLTGLSSRREAERRWQEIPKREGSLCLLVYDIEGFREINSRNGSLFGDKLLLALAHILRAKFPEEGALFRWGADEFLVMAEGSLANCVKHSRYICDTFAAGKYCSAQGGSQAPLKANLACGGAQYVRGETLEEFYRRSRENLEQSRGGARQ
jgi:diguanylate cyclase (GGDEF)-like protein